MKKVLILVGLCVLLIFAFLAKNTPEPSRSLEGVREQVSLNDIIIPAVDREVFYILPHVSPTAQDRTKLLAETLDMLEPGGAQGRVQVGYMLGVSLYSFLTIDNGQWTINTERLATELKIAVAINRPVVIYLAGDHFVEFSDSLAQLSQDEQNVMQIRGGGVLNERYFETQLNSASMLVDQTLPISNAREKILNELGKVIAKFQQEHSELLVGIVLNGETHHLFRDFYSGTGVVKDAVFTDYSPLALQHFQQYLASIGQAELKADDVVAIDFNRFEGGILSIEGWVDADGFSGLADVDEVFPQYQVNIYINGEHKVSTKTELNRLDVYQARASSQNPNVGFRYNWDFSQVPGGTYTIQATVVDAKGKEYEIGRRTVSVQADSHGVEQPEATEPAFPSILESSYSGYLDRPEQALEISYVPLARHWLRFREKVVADQINFMSRILQDNDIPKELIYSYQLTPWMVGGWNPILFGVGEDFFTSTDANPGVTVYGGNALNPEIFKYLPQSKPYAVPEWHPQMDRSPMVPAASLYLHYKQGAKFLSPYYVATHDRWEEVDLDPTKNQASHERMMLAPHNPLMGSRYVYEAIVKFAEM